MHQLIDRQVDLAVERAGLLIVAGRAGIITHLMIQEQNPAYAPFAARLRQLAEQFEEERILDLLEQAEEQAD